jgi:tetratricopeptide (TPR) repeat protein
MSDKPNLPPEIERYYGKWKKDPQSRIFAQLADAYRKSGMLDEAIKICLEGLKVHPSYGSARMVLARAYQERSQDAEAEREFLEIIKNDPNNLLANRLLADLLYKRGNARQAFEQFQKVLKLAPLDREIKEILGKMEASLGVSAIHESPPVLPERLEQGIEEAPPEQIAAVQEGQPQAAPIMVLESTDKASEDAFLTETIADLYLKQGLHGRAVEIYSKMLATDPDNLHIRERLGEALDLQKGGDVAPPISEAAPEPLKQDVQNIPPVEETPPDSFLLSSGDEFDEGLIGTGEIDFDRHMGMPSLPPERVKSVEALSRWLEVIREWRVLRNEPRLS